MQNIIIETARRVIFNERDALTALGESLDENIIKATELILNTQGRVICAGVGKSGHVVRKIAATLASTGTPAQYVHPTEASHGDLGMITDADTILMLSRSGETQELGDLLHYARRFSIPVIAMTCVADSTLGRAGAPLLRVPNLPEACGDTKAPTVSTTLMMALGDALAVSVLQARGFTADNFKVFHPGGKLGAMLLTIGEIMARGTLPLISQTAKVSAALEALSEGGFGCVGVCDDTGKLIGMMTDGDVRRMFVQKLDPEHLSEVMTPNPLCFHSADLAVDALREFNTKKITQAFVTNERQEPVGVVHMHMLLGAGLA